MKMQYYHFASIDSTQTFAKSLVATLPPHTMAVVSANEQTEGRGRFGKSWISPAGKNITFSLVLPLPQETTPETLAKVSPFIVAQFFSLLLQEFFSDCTIEAQLKWPNDLLVDNKKIAGILVETHDAHVIVGIGLNVAMDEAECRKIPQPATSMAVEMKKEVDPISIERALLQHIQNHIAALSLSHILFIRSRWHKALQWMVSTPRLIEYQGKTAPGTITAIHPDGNIEILVDGKTFLLSSGTVF